MTKFAGRRGKLGLAIEDTRGVGQNPEFWVPISTLSFKDIVEEAREEQGLGVLADSDSKYVMSKMGEGEIESELHSKALGAILTGVFGALPSTTGTNPYTHAYTLSQTNQGKSLCLYWYDPDRSDMYALAMVDSFGINVETNGIVKYTIGFKSKSAKEWTIQSSNYTSIGNKFLHQHVGVRLASNIAGLSGATAISLKSFDITFNRNTAFDSVMGTVEPEDILNQQMSVEGSMTLNLEDDTYRDYMLNGTYRSMEFFLNRSSSESLKFQMPRVDFSEWEPDYTLNEIVKQTINFKANYDAVNALDIVSLVELVNEHPSYS